MSSHVYHPAGEHSAHGSDTCPARRPLRVGWVPAIAGAATTQSLCQILTTPHDMTQRMRTITRRELTDIKREGAGVVLVDHRARTNEKASTLHAVTCRWAAMTRGQTPLRFATDDRTAARWLRRERGEEGDAWQRCPACGGRGTTAADHPPARQTGTTVWTTDKGRELGYVLSADSKHLRIAEFDSPARPAVHERGVPATRTSTFAASAGDRCFVDVLGSWRPAACSGDLTELADTIDVVVDGAAETRRSPFDCVRFRRPAPGSPRRPGRAPRGRHRPVPCTRRLRRRLHADGRARAGIAWGDVGGR